MTSGESAWGRRARKARDTPKVYRVGDVNRAVRQKLESTFRDFWVEGEVSEATQARSGHVYFTLSDEGELAKIPCVLFRNDAERARVKLAPGVRVRVRGGVTFYEAHGRVQVIARVVLPAGDGDLAARFEKLRKRLDVEGLLDPARKRPLPRVPRRVGVVTSTSSAALQDILRVAHARAPIRFLLADCRTQGPDAPRSIVAALRAIQQAPDVDVIILGRGGGSAEELWAFNDERVARAVAACRVPVVCGVGHESDTTIAELVADARASTPSNAAELAVAPHDTLVRELEEWMRRLQRAHASRVDSLRLQWSRVRARLLRPDVSRARRTLLEQDHRATSAVRHALRARRREVEALAKRVDARNPRVSLGADRVRLVELQGRLLAAMHGRVSKARSRVEALRPSRPSVEARALRLSALRARADAAIVRRVEVERARCDEATRRCLERGARQVAPRKERLVRAVGSLEALSPLRVLGRGYAIAFDEGGRALTDAAKVQAGDVVRVRLATGRLDAEVRATHTDDEDSP